MHDNNHDGTGAPGELNECHAQHLSSAQKRCECHLQLCGRQVAPCSACPLPNTLITGRGEVLHAVPVLLRDRGPRQ